MALDTAVAAENHAGERPASQRKAHVDPAAGQQDRRVACACHHHVATRVKPLHATTNRRRGLSPESRICALERVDQDLLPRELARILCRDRMCAGDREGCGDPSAKRAQRTQGT